MFFRKGCVSNNQSLIDCTDNFIIFATQIFSEMINRVLIRIRVLQVLYSFYINQEGSIQKAETELFFSFRKSYDLYFFLLLFMVEITDCYKKRVEQNKAKLLPTEKDLNPNTRLIENRFIDQLKNDRQLTQYLEERPLSWQEYDSFVKSVLNKILSSDIYLDYLKLDSTDYETDREFWQRRGV